MTCGSEPATLRDHALARLASGRDGAACGAVCRRVLAAIDAELEALQADGAPVACTPGCSFCCHQRVGVLPHEAIALFEHLDKRLPPSEAAAIRERVLANARAIDAMMPAEHTAANLRCAFLVDGRCAAYEVRPSACASYHSLSRARCEHAFAHPHDLGTPRNSRPALRALQSFTAEARAAVEAALGEAGVSTRKGELHQLVRDLLEDPSVSAQWLGAPLRDGDRAPP